MLTFSMPGENICTLPGLIYLLHLYTVLPFLPMWDLKTVNKHSLICKNKTSYINNLNKTRNDGTEPHHKMRSQHFSVKLVKGTLEQDNLRCQNVREISALHWSGSFHNEHSKHIVSLLENKVRTSSPTNCFTITKLV